MTHEGSTTFSAQEKIKAPEIILGIDGLVMATIVVDFPTVMNDARVFFLHDPDCQGFNSSDGLCHGLSASSIACGPKTWDQQFFCYYK